MEHLSTYTNRVPQVYGYCSNSVIMGRACHQMRQIFQLSSKPTKRQLMYMARDVAAAVADLHYLDEKERPVVVHTDLGPDQFLYMDGSYKLNDFNRAQFLSWNPMENKSCGYRYSINRGRWRSPEEYRSDSCDEKADIYAMGNVFYFLLTGGLRPFEQKSHEQAAKMVASGTIPEIPAYALSSSDPFDAALVKVIRKCWNYDPRKRPSAHEVVTMLNETLHAPSNYAVRS